MVQTPQQRRANEKYAKGVEKRAGKPESAYKKKEARKSPVGVIAVVALIFVVIAPLLIEQLRLMPAVWGFFLDFLAKIGLISR
ncbi:hypothetical protein B0A52_07978 [Exophiala mesophila]|uniref:Stress-associated endoplasmic reticulum protein n=1 Tax=Exophiala mesophila TaxID=212818 RepID=A0A438MZG1_EXOME|nr:hypothetical protein B0A52_07978 [Exophiala mesophila]